MAKVFREGTKEEYETELKNLWEEYKNMESEEHNDWWTKTKSIRHNQRKNNS